MLIYIEGNIGTGKSTFLKLLNNRVKLFLEQKRQASVVYEPVEDWMNTKDSDGKNILTKFYEDQTRYSFTFQMNSFITRAQDIYKQFANFTPEVPEYKPLIFVERSIYTDRHCFAKNCYESGKMTKMEYDIYCRWNDWLSDEFNLRPDAYIYLKCNPNISFERICKRSREGEDNIPIEYLQLLHDKHESWLTKEQSGIDGEYHFKPVPVLEIDVTEDFMNEERMDELSERIYDFVESL